MCFLRHLDDDAAIKTLMQALPYKTLITAIGLDSSEIGNPPSKFQRVFEQAKKEGFLMVAHAGEEWPAEYIWEAIDILKVSRIDHGNHCLDDEKLVQELVKRNIPLTLCPLSNLKLKVIQNITDHPLKKMMEKELVVTINSDDPAYFWWYIEENYLVMAHALDLSKEEIYQLAKNSVNASFLNKKEKNCMIKKIDTYYQENK